MDDPNKIQFHSKHDPVLAQLLVLHVQYFFVLKKPLVSFCVLCGVCALSFEPPQHRNCTISDPVTLT